MAVDVAEILQRELRRSQPDYVTYVPGHWDGSTNDALNEHFLVFDGPDGSLMAVWTQSSTRGDVPGSAGRQHNRIQFSRSEDEGVTWASPKHIAGPPDGNEPPYMASWAFPMVSRSGRLYVIWNQNQGVSGWIKMHTGTMSGRYSDDYGATWSEPQDIPMPRSPFDDPDPRIPSEWIVWQIPMRDLSGGYLVGFSRWLNKAVARYKQVVAWPWIESVVEFMRFVNVDDGPEPKDLRIRYSAWGDNALRVPHWKDPLLSVAQEPSLVRLPDKRLFCTIRTMSGYIWYSLSADDGETWCNPRPLLRRDGGQPILEPICCCPIYQLADGRFVLVHHNNSLNVSPADPKAVGPRRPCYLALGEFRPGADQPVWFSGSKLLMDNEGYRVDGQLVESGQANDAIGVYSSFTTRGGSNVLWHPERKFFLVGKRITQEFLADLRVPVR